MPLGPSGINFTNIDFSSFSRFLVETVDCSKGSRLLREMGLILSERMSKTMGIGIENDAFDKLESDMSLIKGGPGPPAGGTLRNTPKGHLPEEPEGECFAPCS